MADTFRAFRQFERQMQKARATPPSVEPPRLIATIIFDDEAQTITVVRNPLPRDDPRDDTND